jgi:hypothetical protein
MLKMPKLNPKLQAAAMSYLRAAVAAVGALYLSGITDPKVLANAFIAALVAPLMKAVKPAKRTGK